MGIVCKKCHHIVYCFRKTEPSIKAPKKGKPDRKVGYLKMVVMEDLKAKSINTEVEKSVNKTASALTDGKGYAKLKEKIAIHHIVVASNKTKWLYSII